MCSKDALTVGEWLAAQPLPAAAREQVTVALAMIDGIEAQIAPLDKDLRAYAHPAGPAARR